MDVACPQCGNPNLDVDAENNVVYCKRCGFSVQVDPQTGNVTPLSPGGPAPGAGANNFAPPAAYSQKSVFGMEPFIFFLVGTVVALALTFLGVIDLTVFMIAEIAVFVLWWLNR